MYFIEGLIEFLFLRINNQIFVIEKKPENYRQSYCKEILNNKYVVILNERALSKDLDYQKRNIDDVKQSKNQNDKHYFFFSCSLWSCNN